MVCLSNFINNYQSQLSICYTHLFINKLVIHCQTKPEKKMLLIEKLNYPYAKPYYHGQTSLKKMLLIEKFPMGWTVCLYKFTKNIQAIF